MSYCHICGLETDETRYLATIHYLDFPIIEICISCIDEILEVKNAREEYEYRESCPYIEEEENDE